MNSTSSRTVLLRLWDGKELLSVDQMNPIQARKVALAFVNAALEAERQTGPKPPEDDGKRNLLE